MIDRRLCVAPMMDWTDRHFRYFARLLSKHALLYTEMVTTQALLRGNRDQLLAYSPEETPIACQLGGSDPQALASCARWVEDAGFSEVNLNVGCPSDRVQKGLLGACLMAYPERVAACCAAMKACVAIPVTVKTRIGIDHHDSYEALHRFIHTVNQAGCTTFIIHARKAWLSGLSPKQNREIPPLNYDYVYALKRDFPACSFVLNGGLVSTEGVQKALQQVDGVMLGRAAYHNPYLLAELERVIFNEPDLPSRENIMEDFIVYAEKQAQHGVTFSILTRHILGLYTKEEGARRFRRYISENLSTASSITLLLQGALKAKGVHDAVL